MIRQKGIIYFPILLIVVLLIIFILVKHYEAKSNDLSIEPPALLSLSAYFKTTEGKKLFHKETFGISNKKEKDAILGNIDDRLANSSSFERLIISLQEEEIYFFDKTSHILRSIPLPNEIKEIKKVKKETGGAFSLELFTEELNPRYYLINFSYNQEKHFTYLFDKELFELTHLKRFDEECQYIFCYGPGILKKLSEDEFVLIQGAGDSCWSAGVIHRLSLGSMKIDKLFDYSNGCSAKADAYFGILENSFVRAKHRVLDTYEGGYGPDDNITEIYTSDLSGQKYVVLSADKIPPKISYIVLNPDIKKIYLHNNIDRKYYELDLNSRNITEITEEQIIKPAELSKNKNKINREDDDFLEFDATTRDFEKIEKVYTGGQSLGVVDASGAALTILKESFLDKVKFEKEDKQRCFYERSPVLNGKKYPFRYASHEFDDSQAVLSGEYEISFIVISRCNEYLQLKTNSKKWFLGAKKFVLNIKTGRIRLIKEYDEEIKKMLDNKIEEF